MRFMVLTILLCVSVTHAEDSRVLVNRDTSGNRTVRLVAAKRDPTPGQNLVAKFVAPDNKMPQEILVRFPSHSHTTHEYTLIKVIESCVDWKSSEDRPSPKLEDNWHEAKLEATFSVPKDAGGYHGNADHYDYWFLTELKLLPKQ